MKFKAGDLIVGKKDNGYYISNEEMYKAQVIYACDYYMNIQVLDHNDKHNVGMRLKVDNNHKLFSLYQDLKIGDFVTIKPYLQVGKTYGGILFVSAMEKPLDYTVKIRRVIDNGKAYRLDDDTQLYYSREMLVKVDHIAEDELLKPGTKVVPHNKSVWCSFDRCPKWKEAKDKQGYLYVQYYDCVANAYVLNVNEDEGEGNFYKREDFTLYQEPQQVQFKDINKQIILHDDNMLENKTAFKLQLNDVDEHSLLDKMSIECDMGQHDQCVVWIECFSDEHPGISINYDELKRIHKMFGDIIQFVEK